MSDELHQYYEQELTYFKQMSGEFARKFPKVAARLELDEVQGTTDPHVKRLIDAFALLTARIRRKIDDEFPEVVESLLNLLYPHYLRPVPPMAIAQFRFEPQQTRPTEPSTIGRQATINSRPVDGMECTFQTSYPVTVWPLKITKAAVQPVGIVQAVSVPAGASHVLRIQVETLGNLPIDQLKIPFLRFFINGDSTAHHVLYELLFVHAVNIQVRPRDPSADRESITLAADSIHPVGFDPHEGLLPYSDRSFLGYRLLQEYFHFPQKFFFFDLAGLNSERFQGYGTAFEIFVFFGDSELRGQLPAVAQAVNADTFQLGCTPIVNLFERPADPIRVTHAVTEYRVLPDRLRQSSLEVYSVDRVTSTAPYGEAPKVYEPFYSFRHDHAEGSPKSYWTAQRRPSTQTGDDGTDVYLSLVDLNFNPANPPVELLSVRVTCTNRDFVSSLAWRREWGELQGEGLPLVQARCLIPPTRTARPPMGGALQWRLISHLSLNHLSIAQSGGLDAIREILRLYVFKPDEDLRKRINGISGLKSESSVSRVQFPTGIAFCRGLDVELEFDESQYVGSGVYLLAAVLERFFALYSAINSFSRLTVRTRQRTGILKRWPVRIGEQRVL